MVADGEETDFKFGETEVEGENSCAQRHTSSLVAKLGRTHKSKVHPITLPSTSGHPFYWYAENQAKCFHMQFLV